MKSQNNGGTDQSNNQFMMSQSHMNQASNMASKNPEDMQKFMGMFQQMMTNPNDFMKMMMESQTSMSNSRFQSNQQEQNLNDSHRRRQFQVEQHKYRNHDVSPRKVMQSSQNQYFSKKNRQKGQDVLGRYLPKKPQLTDRSLKNEQNNFNNINSLEEMGQSIVTVNSNENDKNKRINTFDERPIISKYIDVIKETKYQQSVAVNNSTTFRNQQGAYNNPFDEQPIKPAQNSKYNLDQYPVGQNYSDTSKTQQFQDLQKYTEAEERPIKGIQGDFKAYLKDHEGIDFGNDDGQEDNQNHQNEVDQSQKPKQFLKRGSRQYLSSAKNKSLGKPKKGGQKTKQAPDNLDMSSSQIKDNMNSSQIKDNMKTRSISQNRVLGGTRKNKNQKSANKLPNKNIIEKKQVKQDLKSNHHHQKSEQYRNQSISPTFKDVKKGSQMPKIQKVQKKKSKNIFQGSSSSESQSQTHKNKISPNNHKNSGDNSPQAYNPQKIEVIKGIFLSKKQLHEILKKHSPNQIQSSQEQKLKQLKTKYLDLCNLLAEEKRIFEQQMHKQRQQFQNQKQAEMQKIKNERKVQQRNSLAHRKDNKQKDKEREQFDILRKQLEKQRQDFKKKDKNNKIIIDKHKKEVEELKIKLNNLQNIAQKPSNNINTREQIESSDFKATSKSKLIYEQANSKKPNAIQPKQQDPSILRNNNNSNKNSVSQHIEEEYDSNNYNKSSATLNKKILEKQLPNYNQISAHNRQQKSQYNDTYSQGNNNKNENEVGSDEQEIVEYNTSMKLQDLNKIPLTIKMVTADMVENMFRFSTNPEYLQYKRISSKPRTKIHTSRNAAERKLTNIYADGGKEVIFETGVKKQYFNNGYSIVIFTNGDVKQKLTDGTVLYFYAEKQVDQITLNNGVNIYRFDNNQVEFHYSDKSVQIRHPDGTFKVI